MSNMYKHVLLCLIQIIKPNPFTYEFKAMKTAKDMGELQSTIKRFDRWSCALHHYSLARSNCLRK